MRVGVAELAPVSMLGRLTATALKNYCVEVYLRRVALVSAELPPPMIWFAYYITTWKWITRNSCTLTMEVKV
jgi:hypothetical protein